MFRWVPYAMVRIAAFFVAGILLGIYHPNFLTLKTAQWLVAVLVLGYLLLYWLIPKRKRSPIIGIVGLMAVMVSGYVHLLTFSDWNKKDHLSTFDSNILNYVGYVSDYPEEKENSWKYEIKVKSIYDGDAWKPATGKVLVYVKKDSLSLQYFYGDRILVRGAPQLLSPPQNPHEFNFKRFLSFKNIYHQHFVKENSVQLINHSRGKYIWYYSHRAREWASEKLQEQLPNKQEQAIAMALTLGVKDGIDNELQTAYAASGAMHVLAVSGLHVGILYGIVLLLLNPLKRFSWSRWVIAIISLLVLWCFAFITGLSPSVLRAVTMFSFIAMAKPFGRRTSIYNTLACSAFLLLLVDPYLIMSVGFQLSYLAVLGIVTIHRPLYQLFEPKSAIIDWVWNISCVSIAAQLATFSLAMLYFHQFPVYFLFSNLFVIPGAVAVLVTSIMVIAFSFFAPLAGLAGTVLGWFIKILNFGVFAIEKIPGSLINDIYITTAQCWFLILAISFVLLFIRTRKLSAVAITLFFVACFSVLQWIHYAQALKNDLLVVYNVSGHHGIEWISNGKSKFFGDSALVNDAERMRFHIRPNRLYSGVSQTETHLLGLPKNKILSIKGKIIGLVNQPIKSWPQELKLDYIIVGNNSIRSVSEMRDKVNFDKLILDSSNSRYLVSRIMDEGDPSVHAVLLQGAFVENF